jgi:hypothetical protein
MIGVVQEDARHLLLATLQRYSILGINLPRRKDVSEKFFRSGEAA